MKYIEIHDGGNRIKISNDITFQDITIYPEDNICTENLIVKLVKELLKEE